ncbi:[FeFe] hydrogenase H-cluster radical SAM maturase HydE [Myxococcota bacterium]|nr:[FeFe] hydrogenase H-cluster radical SAM maturase HydE [Myxococcota bacterium]
MSELEQTRHILETRDFSEQNLAFLLDLHEPEAQEHLRATAYAAKLATVGNQVYYRGLIEFSNRCAKNCYYCGIRAENAEVERYVMSAGEILEAARWAFEMDYGSVVLQSGELSSPANTDFVEEMVRGIKELSGGRLGITLSVGEQTEETYRRWYEAGAHRYLLRVETTSRELYARLHPADHDFDARVACLRMLGKVGYQVGTGVMIGLPGQTPLDLARDVLFFRELDVDMIGMGPFLPHHQTPLADGEGALPQQEAFARALAMISVVRCVLPDVNIASTTALQAIEHTGREKGLLAGANIIMPNLTHTRYRTGYQLYDNKPCMDENAQMCRGCLEGRIQSIGESVGYGQWGDSPHAGSRPGT